MSDFIRKWSDAIRNMPMQRQLDRNEAAMTKITDDDVSRALEAWFETGRTERDPELQKPEHMHRMRAALKAARLASTSPAPDGWVLVPREATPEMRDAGIEPYKTENVRDSSLQGTCGRIYAAMLAAAPQPVVEKENG